MRLTGKPKLTFVKAQDVRLESMRFLWTPRIPQGELTLIQGDPGLGKSFFLCGLFAALTGGNTIEESNNQIETIETGFFFSAEDSHSIVRSRLETMNAELGAVMLHDKYHEKDGSESYFSLNRTMAEETFHEAIEKFNPQLVVVDPLISYLGGANTHQEYSLRPLLDILARTAHRYNLAVVASIHLNKGDAKALYRAQGNVQFAATARSVMMLTSDPKEPDQRVLTHIKANYAKKAPSLNFSIVENSQGKPYIQWGDEGKWTIEELMDADYATPESQDDLAKGFLLGVKYTNPAMVDPVILSQLAKKAGIKKSALTSARKQLGFEYSATYKTGDEDGK